MHFNGKKAITMLVITSMLLSFAVFNSNLNIVSASPTTLYISPTPITVFVCSNFTVALNVADVTDLYAWEVKLSFNPNLLECLDATQGPFLPPPTIWIPPIINNTAGTVHMACSRMFPPGQSGSGTLAYIEFHCDGPGECDLVFLYPETFLLDSDYFTIDHSAVNGSVIQRAPVGGVWVPVDKLGLLAPYIALASTIISAVAVTAVLFKRKKKQ